MQYIRVLAVIKSFKFSASVHEHVLYGANKLYANFAFCLTDAYSVLMAAGVNESCCIKMAFCSFQNLACKNSF